MRFRTIMMMTIAAPLAFGVVTTIPVPADAQAMSAQEIKQARRDASRQLKQARNAVKQAEKHLSQAEKKNKDVEAAQAELDAARAELAQAEQAFKDAMALQATESSPLQLEAVESAPPQQEAVESGPPQQETVEIAPPKREAAEPAPNNRRKMQTEAEPVQTQLPGLEDTEETEAAVEQQRLRDEQRKKRRAERRKRLLEQETRSGSDANQPAEIITESEAVGTELDAEQARQVERLQRKLREQEREIQRLEQARERSGDEQLVRRTRDGRVIVKRDDQLVIRGVDDNRRFLRHAQDVVVEDLPRGQTRTTIVRPDGTRISTVRDRYGYIVYRVRRNPYGREYVLIDNRHRDRGPSFSVSLNLPPLVVPIPREEYIVDLRRADRRQLRRTLIAPPVVPVDRVYTLEEIRESKRVRDMVRSVNLNNVLFETNSAEISPSQALALAEIGYAMEDVLIENPDAVFFIEGHADAPGSAEYNLYLSDQRAESVAIVLSENFDIPPENLITQGYGEELLLIPTLASEPRNRRVTVRPITDLVRPREG